MKRLWSQCPQSIRYLLVTTVGSIIDFALLGIFLSFQWSTIIAGTLAFLCGSLFNFECSHRWVFPSTNKNYWKSLLQYFSISGVLVIINGGLLYWLMDMQEMVWWLAKIITNGIIFLLAFTINKYWTFRDKASQINTKINV